MKEYIAIYKNTQFVLLLLRVRTSLARKWLKRMIFYYLLFSSDTNSLSFSSFSLSRFGTIYTRKDKRDWKRISRKYNILISEVDHVTYASLVRDFKSVRFSYETIINIFNSIIKNNVL